MDIVIHATYSGIFIKDFPKFQVGVTRAVNLSLVQGGNYLLAELQKATPVGATGNLRKQWKISIKGNPNEGKLIEVNISNDAQYLGSVEMGRRAGPVSKQGIIGLQLWVQRKLGIGDDKKSLSIAYAIAQVKKKKATPGQEFVKKTVDRVIPEVVDKVIGPAAQRGIDEVGEQDN